MEDAAAILTSMAAAAAANPDGDADDGPSVSL